MKTWRALIHCRSGAAAAEMALVTPLLVLLLFGGIETAYYFYCEHQVVKGVRDGARFASRQSFTGINCLSGSSISGPLQTDIKEVTRTGSISGGTPRVPSWDNNDQVTIDKTCAGADYTRGIYATEPSAPIVTVSATVPYQSLFAGVGIINDSYQLKASQQTAVMGI